MKRAAPYIVMGLLVAEMALLRFFGEVTVVETPGVNTTLPDRVGAYTAVDFVYCQSDQCLAATKIRTGEERPKSCASCGGPVESSTLAERTLLPPGTRVIKRSYESTGQPAVHVSIVVADRERRSIHKPQVCLTGQGFTILDQEVHGVPVSGNRDLPVMFLHAEHRRPGVRPRPTCYAYWFISPSRETPHHLARLFWIAADGALLGKRYTWAYVAVSANGTNIDEASSTVADFIAGLYPHLVRHEPSSSEEQR